MKLLFIHEAEKVKRDQDNNLYTTGSYNQEVWDRYLSISDELVVLMRQEKMIYTQEFAITNYNRLSSPHLTYKALPNLMESVKNYFNVTQRRKLKNIILQELKQCDCVIARSPSTYCNYIVRHAKKLCKPVLIELVGCSWDSLWNHSLKGKFLAPILYLSTRQAVLFADQVLYVTDYFLQHRYPTKGKSIACSDVVLPPISDDAQKHREDHIYHLHTNIILGTLAAVNVKYKGQEYVIQALAHLKQQGFTNYVYQLVGGGNSEYLQQKAKEYQVENQVQFLGSMPHELVFKWLNSIDIYIQPSLVEGLPRAVIEAMSTGCPVIGSNVGGLPELISSDFLYSPHNSKQLSNLIIKLSSQQTLIKESHRSINTALKYIKVNLDNKMRMFYNMFVQSASNRTRMDSTTKK